MKGTRRIRNLLNKILLCIYQKESEELVGHKGREGQHKFERQSSNYS